MLSENDRIIAERQKKLNAEPVYGSDQHYKSTEERNLVFNREIQIAYALKRLYQIDIEAHLGLMGMINSKSHFRGMLVELLVMNYLLKNDFEKFVEMPQFSTDTWDNTRDILVGNKKIECKGESPVFVAPAISFPADQKEKVLGCDYLFLAAYGSLAGEENWICRHLWLIEPKKMPEGLWLDYTVGTTQDPHHRFGLDMGKDMQNCTPWAKPVAKIPDKIYMALMKASNSLYEPDKDFNANSGRRPSTTTTKVTFPEFVERQNAKHKR